MPRKSRRAGSAPRREVPQHRAGPARSGKRSASLAAGVALVTLLAFAPALRNDFVDWDDPDNFLHNPHYRGLGGAHLGWMFTTFHMGHYQPLSWMSLGLDYLWGQAVFGSGLDPRAYHTTNVLLHAANAALVFVLLRRIVGLAWGGARPPRAGPDTNATGSAVFPVQRDTAAVLGALFFALHPLRVESVAWATERRDVLSSFFLLLTVLAYLRATAGAERARIGWLAAALAAYAASLFSRAMGITLPLLLVLLDIYPLRRPWSREWARVLGEKVPFAILATAAAIVAIQAQAGAGATIGFASHGPLARVLQACFGLVFYVRKAVAPWNLGPIYELRPPIRLTDARYLGPLLLVCLAGFGAAVLAARGRARGIVTAGGAYALLLLPVLGLAQSGHQEVADRYSYLPAVVFAAVLAGGLYRLLAKPGIPTALQRGTVAIGVLLLAALAALTWRQCGVWRNTAVLWTHAARVSPQSSIARNGYGYVLLQEGRFEAALAQFRAALELQPRHEKAWHNLWDALRALDRDEALIASYHEAIGKHPGFVDAHYNLGIRLAETGDTAGAEAAYQEALRLRPGHDRARTNLALLLMERGRLEEAEAALRRATCDQPANLVAQRGLARVLKLQGRSEEALAQLQATLAIDPNDARTRQLLDAWERERN